MHDDAADDAAVIERVLAGDVDEYETLVHRYQTALYRHAVGMILDHDAAADMVQDALLRAYTNLGRCRERARFSAWLFQTLRNRCLDYLKDVRRKSIPLDDESPLLDTGLSPSAIVERNQLRSRLQGALAKLSVEQREAFVMHYVEEIPYETMSELLDASVSALKMRVMRAREALGAALRSAEVTQPPAARLSIRRTEAAKENR
jgi:RNA polymerase sigma-70 factor (ECF subfamily)